MRDYRNLLLLPFILIALFSVLSGFSDAADTSFAEELVKERANILSKVFFEQIDNDKAEDLLYEIETQPLLSSDIRSLREYDNTDIDIVKSMEILAMDKVSDIYGYRSYICDILWHMRGVEGDYVQSVDYNVVFKKTGSRYKISEFNPIAR